MSCRDYFRSKTLKLDTSDRDTVYALVQEMLDALTQAEAKAAFAEVRVKQLTDKNQRQAAIIDNLEKTLWKK